MKINLPTQLTLLRLASVPFFLVFTIADNFYTRLAALLIFIGASLTDWYDGKLARERGEITTLGIFLDPLADKFLIVSAFVAFVQIPEIYVPAWMVVLIIGREFLINGLRTLAASKGRIMPAQRAGKFKTTSQMVCIITILVILTINSLVEKFLGGLPSDSRVYDTNWYYGAWILRGAPYWLTFVTTILTIFSGYVYLRANLDLLSQNDRPHKS
jgi:CDP-diacylglycerol--glycerol-3-phosphate 3-phosphatidyltransferase